MDKMLRAWLTEAKKLETGESTKEEYDDWRYKYPELDTHQIWAKVPSQELLDFSKENKNLDGQYNEDIFEKRNIFIATYKKIAIILERLSIKVIFASRGDVRHELGDNVEARAKQIETICKEYFSGCDAKFEFWGAEEILAAYRKKADYSLILNVKECLSHGKQMVVLASLSVNVKSCAYP